MIRINLLGQAPPKARRAAVPTGAALPVILLLASLGLAGAFIWWQMSQIQAKIDEQVKVIQNQTAEKVRLEGVKREVEDLERQKPILEQRKAVIDQLRRNRTGGQELLEVMAATVNRTDGLWLTSVVRRGGGLSIEGTAGSINAVANFITQMKRSGYFDKIEIRESRQDDRNTAVQTFLFSLTADFVLPTAQTATPAPGKS